MKAIEKKVRPQKMSDEKVTLKDAIDHIKEDYTCLYCNTILDSHPEAFKHMLENHVTTEEVTMNH